MKPEKAFISSLQPIQNKVENKFNGFTDVPLPMHQSRSKRHFEKLFARKFTGRGAVLNFKSLDPSLLKQARGMPLEHYN